MRKQIILLLTFITCFTYGQKEPNLTKYKTSKEKLQVWVTHCDELFENGNTELLKKRARKGFTLLKKDDFEHLSLFNFYLGSAFDYLTEVDSAVYYLEKSEKYLNKSSNKKNTPRLYKELLFVYKNVGLINKRERLILEYKKIVDTTKQVNQKYLLQENLADYYISIGQYETSLKYYLNGIQTRKKALNSKSLKKDSIGIGVKLVNITDIFLNLEKTDQGLESIKESELYIKDYKTGMAFVYKYFIAIYVNKDNIGEIEKYYNKLSKLVNSGADNKAWDAYLASDLTIADYLITKKKQFHSALKYINHARSLAPKYASTYMLGSIDYMSGEAYLALKQYDKALFYLKKAEPIVKEDDPDAYGWLKNALSKTYAAKGLWELAYKNMSEYSEIKSALQNEASEKNIAEMEAKYQNNVKKQEIQNKNLQIEVAKKQKYYFIGGILLLAIIGSLFFYQSRNRKRNNEKLQLLNTELDQANKAKTRFFSILNHDLRGPVANLVFFLQLQKESPEMLDEESTKRMQDKTIAGAENLLHSMEDILQWSKSQMENFKPQPKNISVNSLFEDTKIHFSSEETVQITFENKQNIQINTDENYLKTIIRNLTGNAIKALDGIENPSIVWKTWQENNISYLSITDNGKGASDEQFKALYDEKEVVGIKTGLGLHLIRDLAKAINCKIEVNSNSNQGTTVTLKL
ncbi:HAMP domain-containing histidine kinase [Flavobacterium amnicola]|uniref:histidine kinase n=1 Tax=Flavobacterium amnicola TaxID=2506422 RepID=A0A4V1N2B4_9FLAO|nr:HAMP domain-containing sensor histidine kinase [Flavobacterium amnicola]RXR21131.1 HAMP domain-containing histidine kinase [Flavobacterium amnicola]